MPTLSVPQIHCGSCKSFIQSLLSPLSGIRDLRVDIDRRILSFSTDADKEKLIDDVGQLLAQAGYSISDEKNGEPSHVRATPINARHMEHCAACRDDSLLDSVVVAHDIAPLTLKTELSIEGMTCASCTTSITNALKEHPGVLSVQVKLMLNSATVVHDGNACSAADIVSEIESIGFEASVNNSTPVDTQGVPPKETVFGIIGMTCSSCSGPLSKAIKELEGAESVVVSLVSNSMTVIYRPDRVTIENITSAVEDLGFEVSQTATRDLETQASDPSERAVQLEFQGMFCKECPVRIAAHLSELGVDMITRPTLASPIGSIRYTPNSKLTIRSILDNLPEPITAKVYHPPSLHSIAMKLQAREARKVARLFLIATLFAIPTFIVGIVGMIALPKSHPFRQHIEKPVWGGAGLGVIVLWALATPVQFGVGWVFYKKSYASLFGGRRRQWRLTNLVHFGSMDLLVALSTTTAYFASIAMMVIDVRTSPHDAMEVEMRTYFDSSVFLIFFILAGRLLEGRAKVKTGDAISMLGAIRPERAMLMTDVDAAVPGATETRQVSVDMLELGDTILVQPGSIPPADGTIISGKTTVDESSLTGESRPVEKGPGDILVCGTTNLTSAVTVRVDKLGDATVLEKIVRAVADAQGRKAPIERLADLISGVFVPIVVWLSLIILAIWLGVSLGGRLPEGSLPMGRDGTGDKVFFAFEFTIAVLVVACPCGIGLAAPTAQAVGAGMAAKAGILAQGGGEAFQRASQVTTVVFDKTGTLTLGEPRVTDFKVISQSKWLLGAVREMETGSTHPIALALVRHCESESKGSEAPQLLECEEKSGRGLVALVRIGSESYPVLVGNATLMNDHHVHIDESYVNGWQSQGKTVVFAAVGRLDSDSSDGKLWTGYELAMCFAVADALRPESVSTVAELHKCGKQVWMLSGDNIVTAKAVAYELGIPQDRVVAGVLPHEKADFITRLQSQRVVRSSHLPWRRRESPAVVAFCGDGLNDSAAIAAADVGIGLSHGSQITLSSSSFVLLSSSLSTLPFLLRLSHKVYLRQKLNFAWALVYNVAMIPIAAGAFYALGHTRLPPVWSALAMALSSVSVVVSSLAMRWGL
ncbi:copper resistance-associated P-type ATPase [Rhizoctonia solani 123E]|uniref:P-type Cu(+) transporter n=1 Tax=Rhizoctonia solani 123E TaxID=1423351 RepID=A0A074RTA6_9AGAM|nr:copper resistance-associated P-type ATPase [Rhizoctonia solani 123E]